MTSLRTMLERHWSKGKELGFFHLLTSNAITKVLGVIFILAIARFLDPADVGRINIMLATVTVLTTLGNFGTTTSILKLCSEDVSLEIVEQHFVDGTILTAVSSLLTFLLANVLVIFRIITSDFFTYFQARQQIVFISKLQAFLKIASIATVIGSTLAWKLDGFVYSYAVMDLASFLVYVVLVMMKVSQREIRWNWKRVSQIFHLSKYGAFANSLGQLLQYLDTMVLSILRVDLSSIGHYSVAQYFMVGANQLTYTLNQVSVPRLSFHSGTKDRWFGVYKEYQKTFRIVTAVIVALLLVGSPLVILFLVGKSYSVTILYILILLVGFAARGFMVPYSIGVWSLGRLDYNFYSSLITALINLILNISFILFMGALGASCATAIAYVLGIPVFRHFLVKELRRRNENEWKHSV
jgi:O-antigen/teichoic acid export membrane protein